MLFLSFKASPHPGQPPCGRYFLTLKPLVWRASLIVGSLILKGGELHNHRAYPVWLVPPLVQLRPWLEET